LKRRARPLGIPFKQAINRAIRAGLGEAGRDRRRPAPQTIPHSFGSCRVSIELDAQPLEMRVGRLRDMDVRPYEPGFEAAHDVADR
jgi:hypothetical protein